MEASLPTDLEKFNSILPEDSSELVCDVFGGALEDIVDSEGFLGGLKSIVGVCKEHLSELL